MTQVLSAGIQKKSDDYDEEVIIRWKSSSITVKRNLEVSKSDFGSSGISYRTDSEVNVFVTLPNSQIIVTKGHKGSSGGQLNIFVKYSGDEIVGGVCSEYGNDQNSLEIFDQWSTSQGFVVSLKTFSLLFKDFCPRSPKSNQRNSFCHLPFSTVPNKQTVMVCNQLVSTGNFMDCLTKLDLRNDFFEGIRHLRHHILLQGSTFVGINSMGHRCYF